MRFASVIFDFDSTVVDCETLELVSERALEGRPDREAALAEIKRLTALGMEGAIPFGESLARRMTLIAPTREHVEAVAREMPSRISRSFAANRDFFNKHRDAIYIVSGGFDDLVFPVSDMLGLDRSHVFANAFLYDDAGIASGVDAARPTAHAGGKARAIEAAGLPHPRIIIGDGWTDYEIKASGAADAFIAYTEHAKRERVIAQADAVAGSFDDIVRFLEG